jgi:histone acetyltransferase
MLDGLGDGEGEENTDAALLEELEMGLGIIPSTDEPGDVDLDMEGTGEAEDDAEEESDDEEEEDAEEEDEDGEEEDDDEEEE